MPSRLKRFLARRRVVATVGLFAVLQVGFFAASVIAYAVPNGPVTAHLRHAIASEEWTALDYTKGTLGAEVDHFTECVALTNGLGREEFRGFVANALADTQLGSCDRAAPVLWHGEVMRKDASQVYYRYWNGYSIVTRPILALRGVRVLRWISAELLIGAIAWLGVALSRRMGWPVAAALAVPLFLTVDFWDLPGSIPHALSMAVALAGGAMVATRVKPDNRWGWVVWPMVAGSVYSFVDLMTNPPLAWALVAWAVACAMYIATRRVTTALGGGVLAAGGWMAGYAGTWATKWLLDIVFFGWQDFRTQVLHEIAFRAGGAATATEVIQLNLRFWAGPFGHRSLIALLVLVAAGVVTVAVASRCAAVAPTGQGLRAGLKSFAALGVLAWPALLTLLWYTVVREQSYIQAFFAYRSLGMSLAIVAASAVALVMGARGAQAARPPVESRERVVREEAAPDGDRVASLGALPPTA